LAIRANRPLSAFLLGGTKSPNGLPLTASQRSETPESCMLKGMGGVCEPFIRRVKGFARRGSDQASS